MYVDETVINFMARPGLENRLMASETIEATVVFIDICGFTALAEKLQADALVRLLNTYFDQMVKEIIAQGGYIDKFMGDAVMAVFRAPFTSTAPLMRPYRCAPCFRPTREPLPDGITYRPDVAIGISTGEVVSGNIGSASLKRLDYTIIGDTVNLGQRLQSVAQPGQILITAATYEQVKESFQCQPCRNSP